VAGWSWPSVSARRRARGLLPVDEWARRHSSPAARARSDAPQTRAPASLPVQASALRPYRRARACSRQVRADRPRDAVATMRAILYCMHKQRGRLAAPHRRSAAVLYVCQPTCCYHSLRPISDPGDRACSTRIVSGRDADAGVAVRGKGTASRRAAGRALRVCTRRPRVRAQTSCAYMPCRDARASLRRGIDRVSRLRRRRSRDNARTRPDHRHAREVRARAHGQEVLGRARRDGGQRARARSGGTATCCRRAPRMDLRGRGRALWGVISGTRGNGSRARWYPIHRASEGGATVKRTGRTRRLGRVDVFTLAVARRVWRGEAGAPPDKCVGEDVGNQWRRQTVLHGGGMRG
jgi:hypothetical protein